MPRLRWEEDYRDEWGVDYIGYLGKAAIANISLGIADDTEWYVLRFMDTIPKGRYHSLSSAKRGAERMLDKFLRDAGLKREAEWR